MASSERQGAVRRERGGTEKREVRERKFLLAHFPSYIIITEPPKKVDDSKAAVATIDGKQ
jgi:hypothetical protein